jgi:phosphatidyl-myo-inositol dimannoside synthase
MLRSIDSFIAVSCYSAQRFAQWSRVPQDKFFHLAQFVDLSSFDPQSRRRDLAERYGVQDSKVILTLGRMASQERYKGFDEVIEVMPELIKRFPNLKYMIVGDGDDRGRLEKKAKAMGVSEQVIFAGKIAEQEKVSHLCLADAFVMPSYGEGFGIVFLEALRCSGDR